MSLSSVLSRISRLLRFFPRNVGLELRATVVVAGLAGAAVGLSNYLLVRIIDARLMSAMRRETVNYNTRLVDQFRPILRLGDYERIPPLIDRVMLDRAIAFVEVRDASGEVIHRQIADEPCWQTYLQRAHDETGKKIIVEGQAVPLDDTRSFEAHVYCSTIMDHVEPTRSNAHRNLKTIHGNRIAGSKSELVVVGHLVFALSEPATRAALLNIRSTSVGVFFIVVCSTIPLPLLSMRRLTRSVRRIAAAARDLSRGLQPKPLRINRHDEIGQLAHAFNEMSQRLSTAREQLVAANCDLERKVEQRTAELRVLNDVLRKEIDTKNEFLRTVTHDLNAPLRNISGMVQMIRKRCGNELPDEVITRIDRIEANVEMETSMLDDLLELSRLRSRSYRTSKVDLSVLLNQITDALNEEITARGITCEIESALPSLMIEPNLIRQVLLNLIDNAVKYMGDRPFKRISVHSLIDDDWLVLIVEDTGPGIAKEAQERVFQLFTRGSAADRQNDGPEPSGRGVGLASVRAVVERWDGSVELHSEPGVGSRFEVRIPIGRIATSESSPAPTDADSAPLVESAASVLPNA